MTLREWAEVLFVIVFAALVSWGCLFLFCFGEERLAILRMNAKDDVHIRVVCEFGTIHQWHQNGEGQFDLAMEEKRR